MVSFSGLAIALSFLFGCIFLGIVAEVYYLLWYKKRISNRHHQNKEIMDNISNEISYLFCWKRPNSINSSNSSTQELTASGRKNNNHDVEESENDLELGGGLKAHQFGEESVESELMKLHNLCGGGPPRFLFTIKEETKEDLESEDGKSRASRKGSRTRSLSDILISIDTPFLTPLASPPLKPTHQSLDIYNPLFETSALLAEAELSKLRSSPPPKFKFLRDAEEKLIRRLVEEAERKAALKAASEEKKVEGSFIAFISKSKEREANQPHYTNGLNHTPAQVLPLATSPSSTTFPV
ncbi:OLC1v1007590C1 [Oldenlandia corymbosa var. corymbosa]|uniref:OLC1v1007590C1 n=1 Tax=Oldenlandia corymbosa var. corymbosa TaxID=529605 RepID=A0AAV1DJM2_OLDCO|nr:OLC1v1007590C1 [Oldenlandia corymbosa var. corymbosa]